MTHIPEIQRYVDPELRDAWAQVRPFAASIGLDILPERREMIAPASALVQRSLERSKSLWWTDVPLLDETGQEVASLLVVRRRKSSDAPRPALYYFHGGGLLLGDNRLGINALLAYVLKLDVILVSLDYRLAPEWPYPAALHDGYAGLQWLHGPGREFGVDPEKIITMGSSAGGGLAAAAALLARDRHGPRIAAQMLYAPMLDDRTSDMGPEYSDLSTWSTASNRTGWTASLGPLAGNADVPIYAAPGRSNNLRGMPATYLEVGDIDLFAGEVTGFARQLARDGVPVEMHVWAGCYHGFDQLVPAAKSSARARRTRQEFLHRILAA